MNHDALSSPLVHGVTLTLLLLLLLNASVVQTTDLIEDNCSLVQCPEISEDCPADSLLHTSSDEVVDFDADYDEELPTNNRFVGVPIEELGPLEHSTEKPKQLVTTTTTTKPILSVEKDFTESRKKRELLLFTRPETLLDEDTLKHCCSTTQQCICRQPCPEVPKCEQSDEVAIELHSGNGQPGNCCSTYACVPKQPCSEGVINQVYWRDGCTKCSCVGGMEEELCQNQCQQDELPPKEVLSEEEEEVVVVEEQEQHNSCYSAYLQKPMLHGELWLEDGDCSDCSCTNGERRCLTNLCAAVECSSPLVKVPGKCCPVCNIDEDVAQKVEKVVEISTPISTTEQVTEKVMTTNEILTSTEAVENTTELTQKSENSTATFTSTSTLAATAESNETTDSSLATTATSKDETTKSNFSTTVTPTIFKDTSTTGTFSSTTDNDSSSSIIVDSSTVSAESFDISTTSNAEANSTIPLNSSQTISIQTVSTENPNTLGTSNSTPTAASSTEDFMEPTSSVTVSQVSADTTSTTSFSTISTETPATTSSPLLGDIFSSTAYTLLSTTSAPQPLEPQPTVYRQNDPALISPTLENDYNMVSTQQQMRDMFAEIDSVIIIALLLGFLLSIGLCLVLGVTYYNKEKKKAQKRLYSAIPNSETSLSQTSTNTMLTV